MPMRPLDEFAIVVRDYCHWAEAFSPGPGHEQMLMVRRYLARLYAEALSLPEYECDCDVLDSVLTYEDYKEMHDRLTGLPLRYYAKMSDPLAEPAGETISGSLADDLSDIWRDLKEGLLRFDAGQHDAAGFKWQESFNIHWGNHAADAIPAVQAWIVQRRYD